MGRSYGETIPVRLAPDMMAAVDDWASTKDVSRSKAIRLLIERGLRR